jgi:hypothetical protein
MVLPRASVAHGSVPFIGPEDVERTDRMTRALRTYVQQKLRRGQNARPRFERGDRGAEPLRIVRLHWKMQFRGPVINYRYQAS